MDDPEREWIITPWDIWMKNPFYTGKPGRHPEADDDWEEPIMVAQLGFKIDEDIPF
jgi:hypothetical protein